MDSKFLQRVKSSVLHQVPDAEIILFGSRARDEAREDSDWDLLVLTDEPILFDLRLAVAGELDHFLLEEDEIISPTFFEKKLWKRGDSPFPLIDAVRKEGILL